VVSSIGLRSRRLARRLVDWPVVSSIGPSSCRLARRLVEWPRILSISSMRSRLAHRIVDGRVVLSIGSLSGQLAGCDVTRPFVVPSIERDDDGHTSLRRGEGHRVNFRGWEKTGHRGGGGMKEG